MRTAATVTLFLLLSGAGQTPPLPADDAPAAAPTAAETEFFEKEVRPILANRCYSCHSERSGQREGGLLLDSRPGWQEGGDSGKVISPGDLSKSLLVTAIRYADPDRQMPPDRRLSEHEVSVLEKWVLLGAPDPRDKPSTATSDNAVHPSDPIAGREHWAFRPLKQPVVPTAVNKHWASSHIDRFVLAKLEENGLQPMPDADRRTLMRRLYFQLIGLPPTPEQADAFLSDKQPDAIERLVDTLLASPHFGERWGRHWLDLARYADSNGLDENFLFREAWRYRNNVIDAVNRDVPFDQFLMEQIAGDLLPFETVEQRDRQRIAAGFLVIGPKVLLGNNPQERIMDVADEQLDTIGRAILGQTLGCARCHDHKFDPVPTADYYALAGIMTSTRVMETRYMLGQQRMMEQLIGLGKTGDQADQHYEAYWRERSQRDARVSKAKDALKALEAGNEAELRKIREENQSAVADAAVDASLSQEQKVAAQKALLDEATVAAKPVSIPPRGMIPADIDQPADEAIRLAGQFNRKGDVVARGFLQVIGNNPPQIPGDQSGRLQLAQWLTDVEQGAGRVAARVQANRVWHHLTGRGIVRTVDNFGRTGEPPTHPELLDHLALELIEGNWSLKSLIRKIVLSRTFQLSSGHSSENDVADPENQFLWRANRRRLDPESFRDAILSVAGTLNPEPMDSTVSYLGDQATAVGANTNRRRTDFPCRSIYLPVIRNDLPDLFEALDFADPHAATGMRPQTIVATQALFVLNNEMMTDAATKTAERFSGPDAESSPETFVRRLFSHAINDQPDPQELRLMVSALTNSGTATDGKESTVTARALVCHALFASSRFQILE